MDDSAVSLAAGDQQTVTGGVDLILRSTEVGDDAVVQISTSNTLGGSLGLDFVTWTQNVYANDGQTVATPQVEDSGERTLDFNRSHRAPEHRV